MSLTENSLAVAASALPLSSLERDSLSRIEAAGPAMIEQVRVWSAVNSSSFNDEGLLAMGALIGRAMEDIGAGQVDMMQLPQSELVNHHGVLERRIHPPSVRLNVRPDAPVQIVMTGHYDTVFGKDSAFQNVTQIDADTLNGPGVADMKGGIIVLLAALQEFERHEAARHVGYTVLMNPDEEIGSPASASLIAEAGQRAHMGMTYEPALADGSLAGARKGSGNWSVTFRGKASHAGRDHHLGRSAIAAAADFITRLEAGNGQREGVTFNTGKVDGGGPVNIVPELAIVRFNTRLAEPDQAAFIETHIRACMDAVARRDGIQAELHGGFTRPPKPMAPANAAVFDFTRRAGAALGLTIQWADTGGVCEGNNLWAAGCPNVDTLGVRGAHIHSDRELVKLSSFAERAKLSYVMLAAIADGAFDPRPLRGLAR